MVPTEVAAETIALVLSHGPDSDAFWEQKLPQLLGGKFKVAVDLNDLLNLRQACLANLQCMATRSRASAKIMIVSERHHAPSKKICLVLLYKQTAFTSTK